MLTLLKTAVIILCVGIALVGCQGASSSGGSAGEKVYDIKGKVVAVDAAKKSITIDHEDIPGLMKAMQMDFQVEDEKVLAGLKPGDGVHGKLKVVDGKYLVTTLEKR